MSKTDQSKAFYGHVKYTYLATEEACKQYAADNFVPAPNADTYMVVGAEINNQYSMQLDPELGEVTGLQQGLQGLVSVAHNTNQKFIVLTKEQYDELKKGE